MRKLFTLMATALFAMTANAANGDVSGGWLMAEDFESSPAVSAWNIYGGEGSGTVSIVDNPTATGEKAVSFVGGDYNTLIEIAITLPEGKTLKDYTMVAFDLYRFSDDDNYKQMYVQADDYLIYQDEGYNQQAPAETWTEKSYLIDSENTIGNTFKLRLGIKSNAANYLVDNIRFKEYVEPGVTHNGEIVDGWLMIEDFEAAQTISTWCEWGGTGSGTAAIVANPTASSEKVASFVGGNYGTVLELGVTLPDGNTLKDYSDIAFDLYCTNENGEWKKMRVQADDFVIHYDENDYPQQASGLTWTEKSYVIDPTNTVGNEFKLRLGMPIGPDDAEYMIDNVRMKPAVASGISNMSSTTGKASLMIGDGSVSVVGGDAAKVAIYDVSGKAVYKGTVNGNRSIGLNRGLYIISVGNKTYKAVVK